MHAALPADLRFSAKELEVLRRACSLADREQQLKAAVKRDGLMTVGSTGQPALHPAMVELRQVEAALVRTLGMISTSDTAGKPVTPTVERASAAATARWAAHNEVKARREMREARTQLLPESDVG
jgi:hypothetical protein